MTDESRIVSIQIKCSVCSHTYEEKCDVSQLELGYYKDTITPCPECERVNFLAAYRNVNTRDGNLDVDEIIALGPFQNAWAMYEESWLKDRLKRSPPVVVNIEVVHNQHVSKCDTLGISYIVMTMKSFSLTEDSGGEEDTGNDIIVYAVIYGQGPVQPHGRPATFMRLYTQSGYDHFKQHGPTPINIKTKILLPNAKVQN